MQHTHLLLFKHVISTISMKSSASVLEHRQKKGRRRMKRAKSITESGKLFHSLSATSLEQKYYTLAYRESPNLPCGASMLMWVCLLVYHCAADNNILTSCDSSLGWRYGICAAGSNMNCRLHPARSSTQRVIHFILSSEMMNLTRPWFITRES